MHRNLTSRRPIARSVSTWISFADFVGLTVVSFRALRLHPDKGGDPELFKEVTHAYAPPLPFIRLS